MKHIESLQRNFLRQGKVVEKKKNSLSEVVSSVQA